MGGASALLKSPRVVNLVEYRLFTRSEVCPPGLGCCLACSSFSVLPAWAVLVYLSLFPFLRGAGNGADVVEICLGALIGGRRDDFFWRKENPLPFSSMLQTKNRNLKEGEPKY